MNYIILSKSQYDFLSEKLIEGYELDQLVVVSDVNDIEINRLKNQIDFIYRELSDLNRQYLELRISDNNLKSSYDKLLGLVSFDKNEVGE